MQGKNGWGRTFYMAKGLADLGHNVTLFTINPKTSFFKVKIKNFKGVKLVVLPDFFPPKIKSSGFAIWSTLFGLIYSLSHKFDFSISDCGHRFTSLPCKLNRKLYQSKYIVEWWDFFGKGGYLEKKNKLFKILYGSIESYMEISDKKKANAVIVLSSYMKNRAIENGIESNKIFIVPGGSITDDIKPIFPNKTRKGKKKIKFGYIGVDNNEIELLQPFIEALKVNNNNEKFQLILYGSQISDDKWQQKGLSEVAEYRGWLDYSKDISSLKDIDIFLQLLNDSNISKAGWPNKLGDYLAIGKPIILAPYGDITKFIEGQKGFFIVKYDSDNIANMLSHISQLPNSEFYNMGVSNYELAKTISWKNRAISIIDIINGLRNPQG